MAGEFATANTSYGQKVSVHQFVSSRPITLIGLNIPEWHIHTRDALRAHYISAIPKLVVLLENLFGTNWLPMIEKHAACGCGILNHGDPRFAQSDMAATVRLPCPQMETLLSVTSNNSQSRLTIS